MFAYTQKEYTVNKTFLSNLCLHGTRRCQIFHLSWTSLLTIVSNLPSTICWTLTLPDLCYLLDIFIMYPILTYITHVVQLYSPADLWLFHFYNMIVIQREDVCVCVYACMHACVCNSHPSSVPPCFSQVTSQKKVKNYPFWRENLMKITISVLIIRHRCVKVYLMVQ
jgi:hypothetical protein